MSDSFASGIFEWFLGSKSRNSILDPEELEAGDSFYQVTSGNPEWVIDRICKKTSCVIPHVVISRRGSFPDTKIISASTLLDGNLYRPDRRALDIDNITAKSRRKADTKH